VFSGKKQAKSGEKAINKSPSPQFAGTGFSNK
jgi:hypothetical protein